MYSQRMLEVRKQNFIERNLEVATGIKYCTDFELSVGEQWYIQLETLINITVYVLYAMNR